MRSMQSAAVDFIHTLNPNYYRLHNSEKSDLSPCFVGRHTKRQYIKPNGLWYDIDGDWISWCLAESPNWIRPYIYEVILDESKVLKINTIEEFEVFEDEYSIRDNTFSNFGIVNCIDYINWLRVREKYGAVEITPYFWDKRLESYWYYSWDCASGCVWDSAIVQVRLFAYYSKQQEKFIKAADNGYTTNSID